MRTAKRTPVHEACGARAAGVRAAGRIQFTHADTQSQLFSGSLRLSQAIFGLFCHLRNAGFAVSIGRHSDSKPDATNNSDAVGNNNRDK
jgi:hypothetical protein